MAETLWPVLAARFKCETTHDLHVQTGFGHLAGDVLFCTNPNCTRLLLVCSMHMQCDTCRSAELPKQRAATLRQIRVFSVSSSCCRQCTDGICQQGCMLESGEQSHTRYVHSHVCSTYMCVCETDSPDMSRSNLQSPPVKTKGLSGRNLSKRLYNVHTRLHQNSPGYISPKFAAPAILFMICQTTQESINTVIRPKVAAKVQHLSSGGKQQITTC